MRIESELKWISGSGSRKAKIVHRKGKKMKKFLLGWRLLLDTECPLHVSKKIYLTVFDPNKIFCHKDLGLGPDWNRFQQQPGSGSG
jgi:hypothetical protein